MQIESKLRFSISVSADNARNTASNVPSSRHLANRAYTDCQGPYASGSSRHWAPLRAIQSIPLSIFLSSFRGRPRCPVLSAGSIAFTLSHCFFVNSYRFIYLFSHLQTTCTIFIFQTTSRPLAKSTPLRPPSQRELPAKPGESFPRITAVCWRKPSATACGGGPPFPCEGRLFGPL